MVRIERKLKTGEIVFVRQEVYFKLTKEDAEEILRLFEEQEEEKEDDR